LNTIANVPLAWRLGKRQLSETDGVRLEWRLPVEQLKDACQDSFGGMEELMYSTTKTPPMGGSRWQLAVKCTQAEKDGVMGTLVGLFVLPSELDHRGTVSVFRCTLTCNGESRELA
jgi:hypothetical protein